MDSHEPRKRNHLRVIEGQGESEEAQQTAEEANKEQVAFLTELEAAGLDMPMVRKFLSDPQAVLPTMVSDLEQVLAIHEPKGHTKARQSIERAIAVARNAFVVGMECRDILAPYGDGSSTEAIEVVKAGIQERIAHDPHLTEEDRLAFFTVIESYSPAPVRSADPKSESLLQRAREYRQKLGSKATVVSLNRARGKRPKKQ